MVLPSIAVFVLLASAIYMTPKAEAEQAEQVPSEPRGERFAFGAARYAASLHVVLGHLNAWGFGQPWRPGFRTKTHRAGRCQHLRVLTALHRHTRWKSVEIPMFSGTSARGASPGCPGSSCSPASSSVPQRRRTREGRRPGITWPGDWPGSLSNITIIAITV